MKTKRQYAKDGHWLYQDQEDGTRIFTDYIIAPENAAGWPECTDEEKERWEQEHNPLPEAPEV